MTIYSCRYCVAPKRHPGCHGNCPEYLAEKSKHDELKAAYDKKRAVEFGVDSQRGEGAYKAMKRRRKGKFYG